MAKFSLWIQRFEIYLSEAEILAEKRARELVFLLDDGPFCIITQLGLVNSDEYDHLKKQLQKHYQKETTLSVAAPTADLLPKTWRTSVGVCRGAAHIDQ